MNIEFIRNMLVIFAEVAGVTIGGTILTETVFAWPGVGRLIIDSLNSRDTTQVTGTIIITTILLCFIMLFIDIVYAFVDPRIRAQYSGKKG